MTDPTTLAARLRDFVNENAVCHCGDYLKNHRGYENHSPVAMLTPEEKAMEEAAALIERLVREADEARATATQQQAIIDRLPKTADGVPLLPGDHAYWLATWGDRVGQVLEVCMDSFHGSEEYSLSYGWELSINHQNAEVWSTREAAEAARVGKE